MAEEFLLTQEGYNKIEKERELLVSVKRGEISGRIKEALSYGDISENAEFDAAKKEMAELEERVLKLEDMMAKAKIIDESNLPMDRVGMGLKAKVKDLEYDEIVEFSIVGTTEANPLEFKISNDSPVGKVLLGKKIGEIVEIQVPSGVARYEILEIYK